MTERKYCCEALKSAASGPKSEDGHFFHCDDGTWGIGGACIEGKPSDLEAA